MLQVHKARAQSLEIELERTVQELKGLQVRQQMLETELSQAQRQNATKTDVRHKHMYLRNMPVSNAVHIWSTGIGHGSAMPICASAHQNR